MLIGLKLLKRCIVAIEMVDGDGRFLTALVIGVNNSLRRHWIKHDVFKNVIITFDKCNCQLNLILSQHMVSSSLQ